MPNSAKIKMSLDRIRTIIQTKHPRVSEFFLDFDKLRHGRVTPAQFFRAFEMANIQLTQEEQAIVLQQFQCNDDPIEVDYAAALRYIQQDAVVAQDAALRGSLAGATYQFSNQNFVPNNEDLKKLLARLCAATAARPLIGKYFFHDYDQQNDGIITANQFARGLSTIWEALFRSFPSEREIQLLIDCFNTQRLRQVNQLTMPEKEVSEPYKLQNVTVDYRAFVAAIGAASDFYTNTANSIAKPDTGFGEFKSNIQTGAAEQCMQKLIVANKKFRFDFKSFLQARDKRHLGVLPLRDFTAGCADAISDFKRIGMTLEELQMVGLMFMESELQMIENPNKYLYERSYHHNLKPFATGSQNIDVEQMSYSQLQEILPKINLDQTTINFRNFIIKLNGIPDVVKEAAVKTTTGIYLKDKIDTLNICRENKNNCPVVRKIAEWLIRRPAMLRLEFQRFDKRATGQVTGQQFKQVLSNFIQVSTATKENSIVDYKISATFIRDVVGITFQELQEVTDFYSVDTMAAIGDVNQYTVSPDKLIGSGFLVDYLTFINDVEAEKGLYIPSAPKKPHNAKGEHIIIPTSEQVVFKISEALNLKHLKLADALNLGMPGSTKWNRTAFGTIAGRQVQRSLNGLMTVQISDEELASLLFYFPPADENGLAIANYIGEPEYERDEKGQLYLHCTKKELTQALDIAEMSVQTFTSRMKDSYQNWAPNRVSGYSYQQVPIIRDTQAIINEADHQEERDCQNVTLTAMKHLKNENEMETDYKDMPKGQQISIKNVVYSTDRLVDCARNPEMATNMTEKAAAAIIFLFIDFHYRAAAPALEFRAFDPLRTGFVTPDQFARAFVLARMHRVIEVQPQSFSALTEVYTQHEVGRFQNMIDYAFMMRDVSKPPTTSVFVSLKEMESRAKKVKYQDYQTVIEENKETQRLDDEGASKQGLIKELTVLALKYRPKLRDYFLDFDRGRRGVCEASKLSAALALMQGRDLSKKQVDSLLSLYASERFGYQGCFEWQNFVGDLERSAGIRL